MLSELLTLSGWLRSRGYPHPEAEIWSCVQDTSQRFRVKFGFSFDAEMRQDFGEHRDRLYPQPSVAPPRPRWPRPRSSLRRRRRERAAREAAPLRNAAGKAERAGAGAPGRKRAGRAGAAADMCKMSFKVSVASSGRECRAGRQTCGGEPAPGDLPGSPSPPPRPTGWSFRYLGSGSLAAGRRGGGDCRPGNGRGRGGEESCSQHFPAAAPRDRPGLRQGFPKETPLANAAFWAARRGNLALLRLLLNSGRVDVDCRDSHGTTLLMVASYAGHIDCVRELVLQGADINLQRESGTTALFFAAQQGHNDVVRFLFGFGASTECRTKDGGTALLAASQYGHMQVVETLLKHGANIHDQLYDGATALFLAAQGGYLDVIRLLLSSGAKVNQPRQDGTAPLWIASQMGHSEVVRVMLLRGADRDAARNDGTTALLKAANKGYNDVIKELLKFSPTLGILKNGTSALHAAVLSGNIKTVALLLEAGADPALRNKANELPAELTKNERILRLLRSKEGHRKS
ncbi:ankyrin repeat domain-containing protein 29 [Lynx rufus]|uniref:ankyrin repeat domain-containing protein 29 n=1 Tax=Lynx rufus TaxID=61384 RepID=UPI001F128034|nr:ankyrin repeat domain-containing protein 29 [Lynx rufus]